MPIRRKRYLHVRYFASGDVLVFQEQLASVGIQAAWRLGQWSTLEEYIPLVQEAETHDFEVRTALLLVCDMQCLMLFRFKSEKRFWLSKQTREICLKSTTCSTSFFFFPFFWCSLR
jgi:hypothetical protein